MSKKYYTFLYKCYKTSESTINVKVKVLLITGHWGPEGESRYSPTLSWPRNLDGSGWSAPCPSHFYPQERPSTHCTEGWVGPRAGLAGCTKSHPPLWFDPRTVQPIASRSTGWAIPACSESTVPGATQKQNQWNISHKKTMLAMQKTEEKIYGGNTKHKTLIIKHNSMCKLTYYYKLPTTLILSFHTMN